LKDKRWSGDIVAAVLCYMPERFSTDNEIAHTIFVDAHKSTDPATKALFVDFQGDNRWPYSWCEYLEHAIRTLTMSNLLYLLAHSFKEYYLPQENREILEKSYLVEFNEEERVIIKQIAQEWTKKSNKKLKIGDSL
jgi:hypothetical protein